MGLDNIPHNYPCKSGGTAVLTPRLDRENKALLEEDGSPMLVIDCKATQEAGGCPWHNDESRPTEGGVIGIFGTDCWYRGKYGNALLQEYGSYDETEGYSFYGSNADGSHKTPAECEMLADYIETLLPDVPDPQGEEMPVEQQEALNYAGWWLRWVAEHADGTDCWY